MSVKHAFTLSRAPRHLASAMMWQECPPSTACMAVKWKQHVDGSQLHGFKTMLEWLDLLLHLPVVSVSPHATKELDNIGYDVHVPKECRKDTVIKRTAS